MADDRDDVVAVLHVAAEGIEAEYGPVVLALQVDDPLHPLERVDAIDRHAPLHGTGQREGRPPVEGPGLDHDAVIPHPPREPLELAKLRDRHQAGYGGVYHGVAGVRDMYPRLWTGGRRADLEGAPTLPRFASCLALAKANGKLHESAAWCEDASEERLFQAFGREELP